jgi:hypothetical protein
LEEQAEAGHRERKECDERKGLERQRSRDSSHDGQDQAKE